MKTRRVRKSRVADWRFSRCARAGDARREQRHHLLRRADAALVPSEVWGQWSGTAIFCKRGCSSTTALAQTSRHRSLTSLWQRLTASPTNTGSFGAAALLLLLQTPWTSQFAGLFCNQARGRLRHLCSRGSSRKKSTNWANRQNRFAPKLWTVRERAAYEEQLSKGYVDWNASAIRSCSVVGMFSRVASSRHPATAICTSLSIVAASFAFTP